VRRLRGEARAMVIPLLGWREHQVMIFALGVTVIDTSVSDALELADRLLRNEFRAVRLRRRH